MKAALAMFKDFPCKRRFALLGDMLELGELSREAHEELGRLAAESGLYCLITYGEQAKRTAVVAAAKGGDCAGCWFCSRRSSTRRSGTNRLHRAAVRAKPSTTAAAKAKRSITQTLHFAK